MDPSSIASPLHPLNPLFYGSGSDETHACTFAVPDHQAPVYSDSTGFLAGSAIVLIIIALWLLKKGK